MNIYQTFKKQIRKEYDEYTRENGKEPNLAYVNVRWRGDSTPNPVQEVIAIDHGKKLKLDDEEILYYVSTIDDFLNLVNFKNDSDFSIEEFIDFDYTEYQEPMPTEEAVRIFLNELQWKRYSRDELNEKLQKFLHSDWHLEEDNDDVVDTDYSFIFTTSPDLTDTYIDIRIYYLLTRSGDILVTGTELLDYQV